MEVVKDEELWKIAKKRAGFKNHLASYIIINAFLWAIWYITIGRSLHLDEYGIPWPIWSTLGWGIGLAFNYYNAYHNHSEQSSVQREYDTLLNEKKQ